MKRKITFITIAVLVGLAFAFTMAKQTKDSPLAVGDKVPEFSLLDQNGEEFKVADFVGKSPMVIYFYPKDDTPGCTRQACGYRDQIEDFKSVGLQVFGVSMDDETSHQAFQSKFDLNFPLIVDSEKVLSEALGVFGEQTWGDKTYMGLSRDSFLIDPDGKVAFEWRKVNPDETVSDTLAKAKELIS